MVIRVIKTEPDPSVVKQKVCGNCGVTLEYTPADVQKRIVHDYGGGSDEYRFIKCPSCQHDIGVR